jgi:predicted nucleic acid-binding protein
MVFLNQLIIMKIEFIDHQSKYLNEVISLGTKHSNTLGFMPHGGFIEHARKKWIVVAHNDDELLGYLLFRLGAKNSRISITHLCIKPEHRGNQIARILIDQLKSKFQPSFAGILLSCRKDYTNACKLWEKYGFVSKKEVRSRSQDENYLIKWWYDFNKADLFSFYEQNPQKIRVLLDANIIIKLRDDQNIEHDEVKTLMADWLSDEVEYYIAPEIYNEINRDGKRDRAELTRKFIQYQFKEARLNKDECLQISNHLLNILPGHTDNDNSDRKQIAECISSGIEYFITGDGLILSKRDNIEEIFDITILNPLEFILEINKITNSTNYHPIRLAGTIQTTQDVENKKIEKLIEKFAIKREPESKQNFRNIINKILQNIKGNKIKIVSCPINGDIAFWGYILLPDTVEVSFLRIAENRLTQTLFIQLISEIITLAIDQGKVFIKIIDNHYSEQYQLILSELGFINKNNIWLKIAIKGLIQSRELLREYPFVSDYFENNLFDRIDKVDNEDLKADLLLKIERKLYPLKFSDLNIPCYIIPIKPYWAGQLFDKFISSASIFGANPDKIWNRENVYFRNIKPVTEKTPARILWYVSTEKGFQRHNAIVGVSYLDDMSVDLVKKQFSRFKKYGVYEWENVYKIAHNNINNSIKALKFSDTEVFKKTIPLSKITEILLANNRKRNTFTSPLEVNYTVFNDVYQLAVK